jgi:phage tail-like protein
MMPTALRNDPYGIAHFQVEIDGMPESGFLNVTGLEGRVEVEEYREGGDFAGTRKAPGSVSYSNVVVRRGMTSSKELWEWWERVRDGDVDRRNISIKLLDDKREVVARWNVFQAWPVRYTAPDLNAESDDVAIETLELTHEGIDRDD